MVSRSERIEPFRPLMFSARAGNLSALVAPPYDLISAQSQRALYERSPYNVVRLELSREPDRYQDAAATLNRWRAEGVLARPSSPAIYLYTQAFSFEGRDYRREGLMVALRLEEFAAGRILPHERTFSGPKADRLKLLEATRTNLSPIFGLYTAKSPELDALRAGARGRQPLLRVRDELGIDNELRPITDPAEIGIAQAALREVQFLIADGHHRYETAVNYRRARRELEHNPAALQPYDYVLASITAADDSGLLILPTHRVVAKIRPEASAEFARRAAPVFALEQHQEPAALMAALRAGGRGTLAVALKGQPPMLLRLKDAGAMAAAAPAMATAVRELDVSLLHALVLDAMLEVSEAEVRSGGNIEYTIDSHGALAAVREGKADGAFLMNAPTIADVERVSNSGATMPEKSTYFHPKLLTGLVMNPLWDESAP